MRTPNGTRLLRRVFCRAQFEALHSWPQASGDVAFLAHPHRHVFHVQVDVQVKTTSREVEFILLKRKVTRLLDGQRNLPETAHWSCERWAEWLLDKVNACRVEVSEDGENGAVVERGE